MIQKNQITQEIIYKVCFVFIGALAYGYFSACISPKLDVGKRENLKIEHSWTVACNTGSCKLTKITVLRTTGNY